MLYLFFFFFSSRRRHTRLQGDWSSDVCSSDLRELEEVSLMLPQAVARLASGGRLAVISFQSLEDRIVKRFMQHAARPDVPRELPLRAIEMPQPALKLIGRAIRPSAAETAANPRARSATLRVAERTAAPYIPSPYRIEPDARWRRSEEHTSELQS